MSFGFYMCEKYGCPVWSRERGHRCPRHGYVLVLFMASTSDAMNEHAAAIAPLVREGDDGRAGGDA
jgi:hypothetical protein